MRNVIVNPEKVQPDPRKRFRDCLDDCSRRLGLKPSEVLFFMENSDTLLPDNSDINSLRGRQIIAHGNFVPYLA
ncbi:unnamed protein product [Onchocerca ochengi]|uniref:Ubiquitin-like domain-containing protein n=1 Tax=Onchocerca ochengi TaxID=42157 RepID=A0A182EV12_ONCOC|nr:unnamed protein product [Onchocerca ochengi]